MAFPDAWVDVALVTVVELGAASADTTQIDAHAMTETIDISEPDYPGEGIPTLAGGRVWKQSPQEDGEVTMEIYPVEVDLTANTGFFMWFGGGAAQGSEPRQTDTSWIAGVDRTRQRYAVAIMWTNDNVGGSEPTDALQTTDTASDALRFVALGCRIVSHKVSFTDGILKATVTVKFPAMDPTGTIRCYRWDSVFQDPIGALFTDGDYDSEFAYT